MNPKSASAPAPLSGHPAQAVSPITMAIDIGGSGLKAMLLDATGKPVSERQRIATPAVPTARAVLRTLDELAQLMPAFDRVSVGYPGVTKKGVTLSAANLHPTWIGFALQKELEERWKKPVRIGNDADIQGFGAITGQGAEMVITLGTGVGAALFIDGRLYPNLELGHHPWLRKTYEDYLGRRGLDKFGKKTWNKLLGHAIDQWRVIFNFDQLYLGGGNTKKINFDLPKDVKVVPNELGLTGGVHLWNEK